MREIARAIGGRVNRHPVRAQALVQASIGVATAFGLGWDAIQIAAVMALSAAALAFLTEQSVTPTAAPVLELGAAVTTPDGRPAFVASEPVFHPPPQ